MTRRVVNLAVAAYVDAAGLDRYGWSGESIDVHPDHLARFDGLNGPSEPEPTEPVLAVSEPVPAEDNSVAKPAGNAPLEEWQVYATSKGASEKDLDGKSRNDLRNLYG